jgi:hypothetical protein
MDRLERLEIASALPGEGDSLHVPIRQDVILPGRAAAAYPCLALSARFPRLNMIVDSVGSWSLSLDSSDASPGLLECKNSI